jgi:folate-dependent phosphoribosylglycinamide formyltransferase PurN
MSADRAALLTCDGESGRIAARYLADRLGALHIVVEQPVSRTLLLRRRARRLGVATVFGQMAFMLWQRVQERKSQGRIAEIKRKYGLVDQWPDDVRPVTRVASANAPECIALLKEINPAVVLVMGTRLIEPAVLQSVDAPFINYHAGITPKYRGVHGGYWALAQRDAVHCGVTVHLVDQGIDTGAVLYQQAIQPTARDNFSTYPYLQLGAALPLLNKAADDALAGTLSPRSVDLPSRLWSHPTIWSYLTTGLRHRVW